ncbi:hypothetical protein B0H14DRAFT_2779443 [Mycena olivaceomarginata]|nr:hypothetical protein B0H14DRAFT_2779443 [Mycena olivaceomarginata]
MGEVELAVTITYEGAKARITTAEEATPVIREDLTALGIPHPKRSNVSVVYPGTVRFFWIALPHAVIRKSLIIGIRPKHDQVEEHRAILDRLSIRSITLKESPAKPEAVQAAWRSNPDPAPRPDWNQNRTSNAPGGGFASSSSYDRDTFYNDSLPSRPKLASSSERNYNPVWVKAEPAPDTIPPAPPPPHRTNHAREDEMQIDSPPPSWYGNSTPPPQSGHGYAPRVPLNRNRYYQQQSTSDSSFKPHESPEVQDLRRQLQDVRRQLRTGIAEEREIVENLRDLGVEVESDASEIDFSREHFPFFETELQAEREKRRRLEDIIEDIRRERREPFVVPALLDASLRSRS